MMLSQRAKLFHCYTLTIKKVQEPHQPVQEPHPFHPSIHTDLYSPKQVPLHVHKDRETAKIESSVDKSFETNLENPYPSYFLSQRGVTV